MCSGERPMGAANGKQPNTEALCQTLPLPDTNQGRLLFKGGVGRGGGGG